MKQNILTGLLTYLLVTICVPYNIVFVVFIQCLSQTFALQNGTFLIDYDNDTFLKDGAPFRYISGSIHYARVPEFYWRDRLEKMYTAGLNAAEVYVFWNFHETEPGVFDFTGQKDLVRFLQLAQEIGLLVILRPGPYSCAEWDYGGFPPWILKEYQHIVLRSMDPDYLRLVDRWFDELLQKVKPLLYKNGGPIISLQVENEYGSYFACSHEYVRYLRTKFMNILGDDVILFTTDGDSDGYVKCGYIEDVYTTVDFGITDNPEGAFSVQRKWQPHGPLVNSEFYDGWLDHWGENHSTVDTGAFAKSLDLLLGYGANVNIYMFHGGTNFGFTNGANDPPYGPVATSYDYDAALSEAGDITPKYMAIRTVIGKYRNLPTRPIPPSTPKSAYGKVQMQLLGTMYDLLPKLSPHGPFNATLPVPMEQLGQFAGFMLYRHVFTKSYENITVLALRGLRDRAYIMIDHRPSGILQRNKMPFLILNNTASGQILDILVENMGHVNYGPNLNNNSKGIIGSVTMGTDVLLNWQMYTINLDNILNLSIMEYNSIERSKPIRTYAGELILETPAFYIGHLLMPNNPDHPKDTFINPHTWGKGQLFINDFNLGRYWPVIGPQVTLFTPKPLLKPYPEKNRILMFELELAPCTAGKITPDCSVRFDAIPIINRTVNIRVDQIKEFDYHKRH